MLNVDVVVISSDDMLALGKKIFKKNNKFFDEFSDNQYLVTESLVITNDGREVEACFSSFYDKLNHALHLAKSKYVLLMLDDYVVTRVCHLDSLIRTLNTFEPDYIRMRAVPSNGQMLVGFSPFTVTTVQSFYRINSQPSLWKKSTLLTIMDREVTPWKMEMEYGVGKNSMLKLTLGTRKDLIRCEEVVKKRKVKPILAKRCGLDVEGIDKLSMWEEIKMTSIGVLVSIAFFIRGLRG